MTSLIRATLLVASCCALSIPAEAARLAIKSTASGGGTLINDGTGDVGTTDGTATGFTSAWSDMGFATTSDFLVYGSYDAGVDIDPTGQLTFLRALATVPLPCPDCSTIGSVTAGELHGDAEDVQNVAWWADLVLLPAGTPLPAGGFTMTAGQVYQFGLSAADAAALTAVLQLYGADNTRIGLSAAVLFPTGDEFLQGAPVFITADSAVPEPRSLLLLGSGLLLLAYWSRHSRNAHGAR